jgi:hypothetical protein
MWEAIVGAVGGELVSGLFNQSSAREQMAFQEEQTGTAYQRAVADMKAAGLNPALAYSQGGASSGTGAKATMDNPLAQLERVQNVNVAKAQEKLIDAQRESIEKKTPEEIKKIQSDVVSNPWRTFINVVDAASNFLGQKTAKDWFNFDIDGITPNRDKDSKEFKKWKPYINGKPAQIGD